MPDVWIPAQMQRITGAPDRVQVAGATVRQVINNLERLHPGIKELLYDAELDDITPGLAVIVDGDVSQLGLLEQVREDSEMHFLPAIGGGRDGDPAEPAGSSVRVGPLRLAMRCICGTARGNGSEGGRKCPG